MKAYTDNYELKEDEYLLKIRPGRPKTGFLTKFNKNGTFPVAFAKWGADTEYVEGVGVVIKEPLPIKVIKEEFRSGWKLDSWRYGMSQNWASVVHPKGFTVEIYLAHLVRG